MLWILLADVPPLDAPPGSRAGLYAAIAGGALVALVAIAVWRRTRAKKEDR